MATLNDIQNYVAAEAHRNYFLQELFKVLRMPTVSVDPKCADEMVKCAEHLAEFGRSQLNMTVQVVPTSGHPCVLMHGAEVPGAPRILLYGHYDVQPADDEELWHTPPFDPVVDGSVLRGRGTNDDKCQFFIWLSALKTLQDLDGKYPVNVSVLLEGEEEIGSRHFSEALQKFAAERQVDAVIISDTSSAVKGIPVLHYALRGVVNFEISLRTSDFDLHSGINGGVSSGAVREMAHLIAKMHDEHGRVTIPGFYDGVLDIAPWEQERLDKVPYDAVEYANSLGVELYGEEGYTTNQRRWFRPTLDCCGMHGGYAGNGVKTIVPATCTAKFSARMVANQDPEHVMECVRRWVEANTPSRARLTFVPSHCTLPYILKFEGMGKTLFAVAEEAVQAGFGCEPVVCRNGGAIGIVAVLTDTLHVPVLMLGFGSPDDRSHAPDEKFELGSYFKGIVAGAELLRKMGSIG